MNKHEQLKSWLSDHPIQVGKLVDFYADTDQLFALDLTGSNTALTPSDFAVTERFAAWVSHTLRQNNCRYGIGGYFEHRSIYGRSPLFDSGDEPRRLHLGVDIWADAGTAVYAPLEGMVHSFQDNNSFGDYGPTVILTHELDGLQLYTLYGHLCRSSLTGLYEGKPVKINEVLGHFGQAQENGHWPPHLHFQLMFDMEGHKGDYPGVCRYSEKEKYRVNIPDPNLILQFPAGKS